MRKDYTPWIMVIGVLVPLLAGAPGAGATDPPVATTPPPVSIYGDSTMPRVETKVVEVKGREVEIKEILRKAIDGEKRKYEGLETLAYTRRIRAATTWTGKDARTRVDIIVQRVYFKSPDHWTEATVLDTAWIQRPDGSTGPPKDEDDDNMSVSEDRRKLTEVPYYLERLDRFRFFKGPRHAADSTLVIEIPFEPMSEFDELPGGKLWLLAPRYQIVREEFHLTNLPFAWALKGISLLTREWQPIEDRWLEKRITGRVDLREGAPMKLFKAPSSIEFVLEYDDYRLNPTLDPKIFKGGR